VVSCVSLLVLHHQPLSLISSSTSVPREKWEAGWSSRPTCEGIKHSPGSQFSEAMVGVEGGIDHLLTRLSTHRENGRYVRYSNGR
jgi:hypothetical protein